MSESMSRGMVLVMSLWDDHDARMLWLDSKYPVDAVRAITFIYINQTFRKSRNLGTGFPATWPKWLRETIKVAARIIKWLRES